MKSVTIVAEDRMGLLADIHYILGKSNISIDGLNVDVVGKKAIIALTVKNPKQTSDVLEKNGFKATGESIVVKLPKESGIAAIKSKLWQQKVNIENMHILSTDINEEVLAIDVDKPRKAVRLLNEFIIGPMTGNIGY